jgi:ABC-type antimicrobial peptide transport system permease subunit
MVLPALRRAVNNLDARLPVVEPTTEAGVIHESLHEVRFMARLAGFLGLVALLLGCLGLYGLLAQDVTRRTREIGIRMALGARPSEVLLLVVRRGALVSVVGIGIGLGGAWGLTRFLRSLLFGVSAMDPATLTAVTAILLCVAVLASYLPARRASRIEPWKALRHE